MTEESNHQAQAADTEQSSRPAAKFSGSGGIQVAVWKQRTDEGREYFTIKMERSYMDGDGNFQSTPYLRDGDLLRAARVLEQADQFVEQEKSRMRSANRTDSSPSR